jgi:hypothetical protein
MLAGGLACPCHGVLLAIEKPVKAAEAACQDACCKCCHHDEDRPSEPPKECNCLSGCCAPFLMSNPDLSSLAQASPVDQFVGPPVGLTVFQVTMTPAADLAKISARYLSPHDPPSTLLAKVCSFLI